MALFPPKPELEDLLDYNNIPVPRGQRVKSIVVRQRQLLNGASEEVVTIDLEDIPEKPTVIVGWMNLERTE